MTKHERKPLTSDMGRFSRRLSVWLMTTWFIGIAPAAAQFGDALRAAVGQAAPTVAPKQARTPSSQKGEMDTAQPSSMTDLLYPKAPPIPPINDESSENGPPKNCGMSEAQWQEYCRSIPHPTKWRINHRTGRTFIAEEDNPDKVGSPVQTPLPGGEEKTNYDVDELVATPRWQLCRFKLSTGLVSNSVVIPGMTQQSVASGMNDYIVGMCHGYKRR